MDRWAELTWSPEDRFKAAEHRGKATIPGGMVVRRVGVAAQTRYLTVPEVARALEVSQQMVRRLLGTGRIAGAYRGRRGKNRPWKIPCYFVGRGELGAPLYRPVVLAATRGPESRYAEKRTGSVPF